MADSLAWTGRYPDAIRQYQALEGTSLSDKAALGLANVYLWSGRPDLARPLYQQSLKGKPGDPEAVEEAFDGMDKAERALRARTDLSRFLKSDSNTVKQRGYELNHYWRGANPAAKYQLSVSTSRYTMTTPVTDMPTPLPPIDTHQREATLSAEHLGMAMSPKLKLSMQQEPFNKAFGSLRLKPFDAADLHVIGGHVNWGNMEFQPQALLAGLFANQAGFDASLTTRPGKISVLYNVYQVSDKNRVWEDDIRFFPSWSPLGPDFKYYVGVEGRRAQRNVPDYWSPAGGYVSGNIGFTYEWSGRTGDYSIYGERGGHVAGEALLSYNAGFEAKRYIGRDWAALLSAGFFRNQRVGAYRSRYLTFGIERLW